MRVDIKHISLTFIEVPKTTLASTFLVITSHSILLLIVAKLHNIETNCGLLRQKKEFSIKIRLFNGEFHRIQHKNAKLS